MKASSFWGRTNPVSVRAPTRSRIAIADYKPYAGIALHAEVTIYDGDTAGLRGGRPLGRGPEGERFSYAAYRSVSLFLWAIQ